jgi:hypothetical protein
MAWDLIRDVPLEHVCFVLRRTATLRGPDKFPSFPALSVLKAHSFNIEC